MVGSWVLVFLDEFLLFFEFVLDLLQLFYACYVVMFDLALDVMELGILLPCVLDVLLKLLDLSLEMSDFLFLVVVLSSKHIQLVIEVSYLSNQLLFLLLEVLLHYSKLLLIELSWIVLMVSPE